MNSFFFRYFINKSLIIYLCFTFLIIGSYPADLFAMFMPSSTPEAEGVSPAASRDEIIQKIQKTLETKILSQRLKDFGLTAEQISSRISQLSDEQLHQISSKVDALQTGGGDDPFGFIIAILVIAILVVVLLQISGHKIIITR